MLLVVVVVGSRKWSTGGQSYHDGQSHGRSEFSDMQRERERERANVLTHPQHEGNNNVGGTEPWALIGRQTEVGWLELV